MPECLRLPSLLAFLVMALFSLFHIPAQEEAMYNVEKLKILLPPQFLISIVKYVPLGFQQIHHLQITFAILVCPTIFNRLTLNSKQCTKTRFTIDICKNSSEWPSDMEKLLSPSMEKVVIFYEVDLKNESEYVWWQ